MEVGVSGVDTPLRHANAAAHQVARAALDLYLYSEVAPEDGRRLHGSALWEKRRRLRKALEDYRVAEEKAQLGASL